MSRAPARIIKKGLKKDLITDEIMADLGRMG